MPIQIRLRSFRWHVCQWPTSYEGIWALSSVKGVAEGERGPVRGEGPRGVIQGSCSQRESRLGFIRAGS